MLVDVVVVVVVVVAVIVVVVVVVEAAVLLVQVIESSSPGPRHRTIRARRSQASATRLSRREPGAGLPRLPEGFAGITYWGLLL